MRPDLKFLGRCVAMRLSMSPRSAAISLSVFPAANRRKSFFSRGLTCGKTFIPLTPAGRALLASRHLTFPYLRLRTQSDALSKLQRKVLDLKVRAGNGMEAKSTEELEHRCVFWEDLRD
jgi:hypothetical protein